MSDDTLNLTESRREKRMKLNIGKEISRRSYNGILCGTLFYGIAINFILCLAAGNILQFINPTVFLIGYFICAIIGILLSGKSTKPIISFIGYNLVVVPVGLVIAICVEAYGGISSAFVTEAFLITMCLTATMTALGILKPDFCKRISGLLAAALSGLVIAELILLLMGFDNLLFAWIGAVIFTLYIAVDIYRSQEFAPTVDNAVDCALDIYLDIADLFLKILKILGSSNSKKKK